MESGSGSTDGLGSGLLVIRSRCAHSIICPRLGYRVTHFSQTCGHRAILHPAPHLSIGAGLQSVHEAMRDAGAPCELLSEPEAARRFPAIRTGGPVLFEPDSCVIAADQALAALASGVPEIRAGTRVLSLADDGRQVTVQTTAGPVTARTAVITAGPWSGGLTASLGIAIAGQPTLEQVGYLRPRPDAAGPPEGSPHEGSVPPIFICHGDQAPYGLPVPGSPLVKIGVHPSGPATDPDALMPAAKV